MYTVFFDEESMEMPQDFETYTEAKEYADDVIQMGFAKYYQIMTA